MLVRLLSPKRRQHLHNTAAAWSKHGTSKIKHLASTECRRKNRTGTENELVHTYILFLRRYCTPNTPATLPPPPCFPSPTTTPAQPPPLMPFSPRSSNWQSRPLPFRAATAAAAPRPSYPTLAVRVLPTPTWPPISFHSVVAATLLSHLPRPLLPILAGCPMAAHCPQKWPQTPPRRTAGAATATDYLFHLSLLGFICLLLSTRIVPQPAQNMHVPVHGGLGFQPSLHRTAFPFSKPSKGESKGGRS